MANTAAQLYQQHNIEEYFVNEEPFYLAVSDEVDIFEAAYAQRVPVLLKGPTGSGKTRFVEYMSWRLNDARKRNGRADQISPLVTVACHEDLTASDLVGRYLLEPEGTRWIDGPLTRAVKHGGICYLDEVVEARKDTTVLIHPLSDHRRLLHIEKIGEVLESHPNFLLVISYNPRLSERAEGSEALHAAAVRGDRVRLSPARLGGADHRARERRRPDVGAATGAAGGEGAEPRRAGLAGGE